MNANHSFHEKLNDLVIGWGYGENEAREMLQDEEMEYGYCMHDFEC